MRFDEDAQLDASQVDDARGRSGGFPGGRLGMAGGGLGIIGVIIAALFGIDPALPACGRITRRPRRTPPAAPSSAN